MEEEVDRFTSIMKVSTIERFNNLATSESDAFGKWSYDVVLNKLMDIYDFVKTMPRLDRKLKELEEVRSE